MVTEFIKYTGTKTIKAMPMGAAEAKRYGANITNEVVNKNLGNNGYLVEYPDGYRSWSPAKQFEEAYRVSETYLDRLRIELSDLKQRILKATDAIYTTGLLGSSDRALLEDQVKAMRTYAEVLVIRIDKAVKEQERVAYNMTCCAAKAAEGGER